MKVIFLDIDGVLNSELFYRARYKKRWLKINTYKYWVQSKTKYVLNGFKHKPVSLANYKVPKSHTEFDYLYNRLIEETDQLKWKWLVDFCEETQCKICISSVWKNHFNPSSDWKRALIKIGFKEDVCVGITGSRRSERGQEIKEWIDEYGPLEKYAIIDDDSDMLPEQLNSFFQTDNYCGLTPTILYRIKRHFDTKDKPKPLDMKLHEIIETFENLDDSILVELLLPYKKLLNMYYNQKFSSEPVLLVVSVTNSTQYARIEPSSDLTEAIVNWIGDPLCMEEDNEHFSEYETICANSILLKNL